MPYNQLMTTLIGFLSSWTCNECMDGILPVLVPNVVVLE